MNKTRHLALGALALALAVPFAGCDRMKGGEGREVEAAAKVNGEAVSIPMLNRELDKLGQLDPDHAKQAANKVLNSLVDQRLLAQKAVADKLEADAEVKLALEAARTRVLAEAVVERMTAKVSKPTDQEVGDYFSKHPELFGERRIYRLQEINIPVNAGNAEAVKGQLASAHSLDDFFQWLKARNIQARVSQTTKAAEMLPTDLVPRLARMRDGQALTMAAPGAINVLVLAGSQSQPVSLEQAKANIERFLSNNKKREAAETGLKDLRAKAKIEFLGAYADAGREAAAPKAPAVVPANETR